MPKFQHKRINLKKQKILFQIYLKRPHILHGVSLLSCWKPSRTFATKLEELTCSVQDPGSQEVYVICILYQEFHCHEKALLSFFFQPSLEGSKTGKLCGWKKLPVVFTVLVPGGERYQPDLVCLCSCSQCSLQGAGD